MRAVVESHRLVELNGINAERVSRFSWLLVERARRHGRRAARAVVQRRSTRTSFTLLMVVAASAAAVFGGLSSIPLALVGGIVLGVAEQLVAHHLPLNSVLARNIRPSMPFILLAVLLIAAAQPAAQGRHRSAVGRRSAPARAGGDLHGPAAGEDQQASCSSVFVAVVCLAVIFVLPGLWVSYLAEGLALTTIFLSITVLVGIGGQISLCQASFAGLGAFTAGQLATRSGLPDLSAASSSARSSPPHSVCSSRCRAFASAVCTSRSGRSRSRSMIAEHACSSRRG